MEQSPIGCLTMIAASEVAQEVATIPAHGDRW